MRVLVTGGTGFIGSHTTRALLEAGHEVADGIADPPGRPKNHNRLEMT